jgi:transaldolase / glucose-6-phosphate isomerase
VSDGSIDVRLPAELAAAVDETAAEWTRGAKMKRLWARDATLWTGTDEASWMGWLDVVEHQLAGIDGFGRMSQEIHGAGFGHVVVLGMGGSSLCPDVLRATFGRIAGFPELLVLDSTDPAQIRALEQRLDVSRTLFIVSSKSGSTLESNIFKQYFFDRVKRAGIGGRAGDHFVAITDPGSQMERVAAADRFRHVAYGVPSIGGRYSALSSFGMVPAAVMGIDVARFLGHAAAMVRRCGPSVTAADNPAALLGIVMGVLAQRGRDKVTLITSPRVGALGAWLEQLLAESTGKAGKGLIPIDRERLGAPDLYGGDRLFVYVRLASAPDRAQDDAVAALERAGQPLVRIALPDAEHLGAEFFRWELATAVAGAVMGVNPFDQPDVEASKVATRALTDQYEKVGALPAESPLRATDAALIPAVKAHLSKIAPGDYVALLAYVEMSEAHEAELQAVRMTIRDRFKVATCLGFGPRFLHSTGQAYKGGPGSGVFLQLTCDEANDLPVPGQRYTFGVVKAAQARGDLQVLEERGRRALRIHLPADVKAGLALLRRAVEA